MKKAKLLVLLTSSALLLAGCENQPGSSTSSSTSGSTTSSTTGSTTSSSTGSTTSGSSSSSSSTSIAPSVPELSIEEALTKAGQIVLNPGQHEAWNDEVYQIKGQVIQAVPIYTYQQALTYVADSNNKMISCLSGTAQGSLYYACKDYVGKPTSNYIIQGKIGMYYGNPCITVTNYELKTTLPITVDVTKFDYYQYSSIDSYVSYTAAIDYNKKGYGLGANVVLKGLKCIVQSDYSSDWSNYIFSDGVHAQSIYFQGGNNKFVNGKVYDIYGISKVHEWKPSLHVLYSEASDAVVNVDIPSIAVSKTATQMYNIGVPQDDTEKNASTNNFLQTFKYFYKSDLYFNYYNQASNGDYVVAGDSYYTDPISSKNSASDKRMVEFTNKSFNTITDWNYVSVKDYANGEHSDETLTTYFVAHQYKKANGRKMPQVYMFEDYIAYRSFPLAELKSFFSGQSYLFNEGQVPMFGDGDTYTFGSTSSVFTMRITGATTAEVNSHINDCKNNSHLTFKDAESTSTYYKFKQNQSNSKFMYELTIVDSDTIQVVYTRT